jgi:predicted lysophospholipase L1 biosynthesis ABC-type transport system permease subunit
VAGLLTARGAARQREIAIRLAVGAGRGRIIRQLLTESVLLAVFGVVVGLFLAYGLVRGLNALLPLHLDVKADLRVLFFTLLISLLAVLVFGLAPAARTARVNPLATIGGGLHHAMSLMARKLRLANTLVAAQVALSTVLLFGAGLLTRTLINLKSVDTGMRVEQLLICGVNPDSKRYTEPELQSLYRSLQERLLALPGVSTVSYTAHPLLGGGLSSTGTRIEGRSDPGKVQLQIVAVGPEFLKTMGMTL